MSLEILHVSLAQLFSTGKPFQMARYQRHYEWGRKEMEQLLDDLGDAFAEHLEDPTRETFHFLGNVILFANPEGFLEVVDGQQRLTSLTLLLGAARDLAGKGDLAALLAGMLSVDGINGGQSLPRLHLHRGDQQFLHGVVLAGTTSAALVALGRQDQPGWECLRANSLIARDWLGGRPLDELAAFIGFVLAKGRCVQILVGREDDAFRIFETVNSRGRPIASEDVLRFALVEFATPDLAKREEYLARWDAMEADLGPRGMKRFINSWRARLNKGARPREALHRTVLNSFSSPAEACRFLDNELSGDLSTFRQIEAADIAVADGPLKARMDMILRSLALLDFVEWLPVVSELITRGLTQPSRLAADLARVERLAWYYYLNSDDKGVYQDRRNHFATLMSLAASAGTLETVPARSQLDAEQCAKMRDLVQQRLDPKWIPLRSLLVRLEMALAADGAGLARDSVTIEHILPLRPAAKGWLSLYDNSQKVVTEYAERIGNLCLVAPELNTQLGNRVYPAKRKLMRENGVPARSPLAADIALETAWGRDVIERRSRWLLKTFCDAFEVHASRR